MQHAAEYVAVFVHVDVFIRHFSYFQGRKESYSSKR